MTAVALPDASVLFAASRATTPDARYRHSRDWCEQNLCIKDKSGRIVRLAYNFPQRELERIFQAQSKERRPIRLMILKARQEGVSTWAESVIYDWITHIPHQDALILAHDGDGSQHLYRMFLTYYAWDQHRLPTQYSHQKGLTFQAPHNSQVIIQTAGKRYSGTSLTIQVAHLSEVAKWPDPETTVLSLLQSIPSIAGTFAIMETTAAGAGDWFNAQWDLDSDWTKVFLPWFIMPEYRMDPANVDMSDIGDHPRYNLYEDEERDLLELRQAHVADDQHAEMRITLAQLAWRRWAIDNNCGGDVLLASQEYPSTPEMAFVSAGTPRFSIAVLQQMLKGCTDPLLTGTFPILEGADDSPPALIEGEDVIRIWRRPEPGHRYVVGADCKGYSLGGDRHAADVIDKDVYPHPVVATLHGAWDADIYASHLCQTAKLYNNALLAIEVNGVGEAVQNRARRLYHHFYHRLPIDRQVKLPGERIGWYTGHITRHNLIEALAAAVREQDFVCWDRDVIHELMAFHAVPGPRGAEAKPGAHDDHVFGLGIAIQGMSYTTIDELRHYNRKLHQDVGGSHMGAFR